MGTTTCVDGVCVPPPLRDASVSPDADASNEGDASGLDVTVDTPAVDTQESAAADAPDSPNESDSGPSADGGYTQQVLYGDGTRSGSFGQSVAVSLDALVVGQPTSSSGLGAAYVFRNISGAWTHEQTLSEALPVGFESYGTAVAISGDTIIVGEWDSLNLSGTAFVYVRSAGVWQLQAQLVPSDSTSGDEFGVAVALEGDTALIGAPFDGRDTDTQVGRAYVFVRNGTSWAQQAVLAPAEAILMDRPGAAVALSGDTALIGAPTNPTFSVPAPGKVYAFVRSGITWSEQAVLAGTVPADMFGNAVSVVQDTAFVGATCPCGLSTGPGSAHVFTRTAGVWSRQAVLTPSDSAAGDEFGYRVALGVGRAVIGAYGIDSSRGAVYEFLGSAGTWQQGRKLIASDGVADDYLGFSVALDNTNVVAGAVSQSQQAFRAGAVYVFGL